MAFGGPFFHGKLCENDIPGAKFSENVCAGHSVTELRRWLECRGLKTNGTKQELINYQVKSHLPCMYCTKQVLYNNIVQAVFK